MKKLITLMLIFVSLLSCGTTAFAASDTLDNDKKQTDIGVYAKAEYNVEGVYSASVTDGKADVITDEGITVSITDAPTGSVRLMVVPVPETEKEAWGWITDSLKATAIPVHAFDIYFEDASGKRIDADGAAVTVNCPHCADLPVVCSLDTDGTVHLLTASVQGKTVTFDTNGSTYYVIAEGLPKQDAETDITPETGYNSNIELWFALLFICIGLIFVTALYGKKRKKN